MVITYLCKVCLFAVLTLCLFPLWSCSTKSFADLPKDILGISVGMSKADAQRQLKEIAVFDRSEVRGQEVWRLKDTSRFVLLTVGYDADNTVHHVAGIVNEKGSQKLKYTDVGNLSDSKQNVSTGNYEYIWDVPEKNGLPAYQVISNGNKPEYSMILTLKKAGADKTEKEEEERERK